MEDNQPKPGPVPAAVAPPAPVPPPALANADIQCIAQAVAGFLQPSGSHPLQVGQPSASQPGKFPLCHFIGKLSVILLVVLTSVTLQSILSINY